MKLALALIFLCGCAIRGESGKVQFMGSVSEDGRGCKGYVGKRVVLKCKFQGD